eukprot:TRINITY_DN67398_c9_g4_i1.p1 TRINITY_DN67398_c9_g4~~TRINITY_DN67398_c9_g4_i1.p1  ORF type:complete len:835 (-),score=413.91 TRINITY_DN67398_c9_g4_i1:1460-3964(-)
MFSLALDEQTIARHDRRKRASTARIMYGNQNRRLNRHSYNDEDDDEDAGDRDESATARGHVRKYRARSLTARYVPSINDGASVPRHQQQQRQLSSAATTSVVVVDTNNNHQKKNKKQQQQQKKKRKSQSRHSRVGSKSARSSSHHRRQSSRQLRQQQQLLKNPKSARPFYAASNSNISSGKKDYVASLNRDLDKVVSTTVSESNSLVPVLVKKVYNVPRPGSMTARQRSKRHQRGSQSARSFDQHAKPFQSQGLGPGTYAQTARSTKALSTTRKSSTFKYRPEPETKRIADSKQVINRIMALDSTSNRAMRRFGDAEPVSATNKWRTKGPDMGGRLHSFNISTHLNEVSTAAKLKELLLRQSGVPGPGSYQKFDRVKKHPGRLYVPHVSRKHLTDSSDAPGPGSYTPNVSAVSSHRRVQGVSFTPHSYMPQMSLLLDGTAGVVDDDDADDGASGSKSNGRRRNRRRIVAANKRQLGKMTREQRRQQLEQRVQSRQERIEAARERHRQLMSAKQQRAEELLARSTPEARAQRARERKEKMLADRCNRALVVAMCAGARMATWKRMVERHRAAKIRAAAVRRILAFIRKHKQRKYRARVATCLKVMRSYLFRRHTRKFVERRAKMKRQRIGVLIEFLEVSQQNQFKAKVIYAMRLVFHNTVLIQRYYRNFATYRQWRTLALLLQYQQYEVKAARDRVLASKKRAKKSNKQRSMTPEEAKAQEQRHDAVMARVRKYLARINWQAASQFLHSWDMNRMIEHAEHTKRHFQQAAIEKFRGGLLVDSPRHVPSAALAAASAAEQAGTPDHEATVMVTRPRLMLLFTEEELLWFKDKVKTF